MISYQSQWDNACLATEGTWQEGSCMQIWCTWPSLPIYHMKVSLDANFVEYRSRKTEIHVEPLLVRAPMEIVTPRAKAFIFTNKWLVARGLYWNMGVSHLSCLSSSQHYLQGLHKVSNSLTKSIWEVSDTVCLHPLTNKLHLWYWLPLKHISCGNILKFVTDVVQRMGVFGKLIQYAMLI